MPTDLEALTAGLFSLCDERLGDTTTFLPPVGPAVTVAAHVSFGEEQVGFSNSSGIAQTITGDVDAALLPGKPASDWRITFARLPGLLFAPRDVERDDSGLRWTFGVKSVNA